MTPATPNAGPPARPPRRWPRLACAGLAVLLAAAAVAGWWYHTTRPAYRLRQGRAAVRAGDWDRAGALADRLEEAGQVDLALLLRGESLFAQQRYPEALAALNRIRDQGPLRLDAAALSGRCLLELKDLREAHRVLSYVLEEDPDHLDARRALAAVAYDMGQMAAAIHHLEEVARRAPRDGRPHRLLGLVRKWQDRHEEAEAAYREALARDLSPAFRQAALLEMAQVLAARTDWKAALAALDERVQAGGKGTPDAASLRAECLWKLGRLGEARQVLDAALEDYPKQPNLLRLRGQVHLADKQFHDAVRLLERAVALAPGDYQCRYQLVQAYTAAGRKAAAASHQKRLAELRKDREELARLTREATRKPWDEAVRLRLAELCQRLEQPDLAAMWFQAARACKKDGP